MPHEQADFPAFRMPEGSELTRLRIKDQQVRRRGSQCDSAVGKRGQAVGKDGPGLLTPGKRERLPGLVIEADQG